MTQIKDLKISQLYQPINDNFFIIHGWRNSYLSKVNTLLTEALLKASDMNVFVLDWSIRANGSYVKAFRSVEVVGSHLASFISALLREFQLDKRSAVLVGYSLGAHIAGCTGAAVNGTLRNIVGLDPAGPLFTLTNTKNRLDKGDAEFVQVIHTAGGMAGFLSSIGHADYFPNDGTLPQPGCGADPLGSCAHGRAFVYYSESVTRNGFAALQCSSYKMYRNGMCAHQHLSYLGGLHIDTSANGDYYLDTNMNAPYGS
ncbi:pancreatic triacylglycerol lipase-like [Photinus pyralis]|uniref:pancreatic triacylglycerol lipase-like n=1 Tax=Photinus pyralis TaxID=7054 RepID=UPI001267422F|nr:pancreatic triacylglycerol lipase-like [Photinus pyralis]XP_031348604.1 pancreatic triacylglycerol lipase-like [Photinus pyralis]